MTWHSLNEQQTWLWGTPPNCWHTHTHTHAPAAESELKLSHRHKWVWMFVHKKTHTWMRTCKLHTHTAHSSWGFGVQRMFYFGNSFGLVTLLWWQTEKQVANIKHFTSMVTHANTHPHTQTHTNTHTLTFLKFPAPLFLLIPRNISPRGECVVLNFQADFSFTSS